VALAGEAEPQTRSLAETLAGDQKIVSKTNPVSTNPKS
jgi:hypothetical protein